MPDVVTAVEDAAQTVKNEAEKVAGEVEATVAAELENARKALSKLAATVLSAAKILG